ncbi:MAG: hypothetical protein LBD06_03535 [Candidatus Accumulibacter sp.]|nr:hypothetical protein [Accumulibacter sp.]
MSLRRFAPVRGRKTESAGAEDRAWRRQKTEKPSARFSVLWTARQRRKLICLLSPILCPLNLAPVR